jgi:hypothetical protein
VADIIPFNPPAMGCFPCSDFRKALTAITILLDFNSTEASQLVGLWVAYGLLNEDEADALHVFYGWK